MSKITDIHVTHDGCTYKIRLGRNLTDEKKKKKKKKKKDQKFQNYVLVFNDNRPTGSPPASWVS